MGRSSKITLFFSWRTKEGFWRVVSPTGNQLSLIATRVVLLHEYLEHVEGQWRGNEAVPFGKLFLSSSWKLYLAIWEKGWKIPSTQEVFRKEIHWEELTRS